MDDHMRNGKLAVLCPVFNGGALLEATVLSCAKAGLSPDRYEILVVDNCSEDCAAKALPRYDSRGAAIHVHRNKENIGRVLNWNRALEIAEEEGFSFAAFLFVGDEWLPDGSISRLLDEMEAGQAIMGMAPFHMVRENGDVFCVAQRFTIPGFAHTLGSRQLLRLTVPIGYTPFGPMQANVFRIDPERPFRFDPQCPIVTDVEVIIGILQAEDRPVVVVSEPYMAWKVHGGRTHMSTDMLKTLDEEIDLLERIAPRTGLDLQWASIHTILLLRYSSHVLRVHGLSLRPLFGFHRLLRRRLGSMNLRKLASAVCTKLLRRRCLVTLS